MRYRDIAAQHSVSEQPDSKNYLLQLERDTRAGMLILHILDKNTGKRTEVRGKMGYETNGYDPNDKLHQLLDKVGKSASVSDLMNGDVVSINPRHPDGASAKAAADQAHNEAFDTKVDWVKDMARDGIEVFATKVDDAYIELTYKRMANDDVYIGFSRGGRSSVTGEGGQNKIFGAVINHITQHIGKLQPPRIVFSAFKPNTGPFGSQDTTRSSLYRKMVQRFASQNGYEYDVEDTGNEDTFILTRKQQPTQTTESLDQPYPYRWGVQSEDEWAARARTDSGAILDIRFEYGSWDAQWDIEFTLNGRYKATAAGDQFRIFATVVKAIKEWWKSTSAEGIPVNTIRFSADKLNNQTGKTGSREKLYNRFAQQFANSIGFTIQSRDKIDATDFELINPNYNEHKVNNVAEGGAETSWSDDTDTITLQDILELTKNIKQINLPINDNLKNKLIHWDGNPEEMERVNQVIVSNQFPILIMVDEQGQIEWILDGNHRLHKAIQSQAKTIPAKLIKPSDLSDKAKKIFQVKEQDVAENFAESSALFTFKIKRRKLNVPALIKAGAIFITYPHGEQGWETDDNRVWSYSLISLYNVQSGGWPKDAKNYLKPQSYKRAEQQINSSAPNLGSDQLVYDGKYNQILWSIKKLGIPDNVAFLDNSQQDVAENFADGKNPGRKGLSKRMGVNTKASVSSLRKTAKNSSGEKQRMAHWLANMKAGRKKAAKK
jgi:hypothetical protein